MFKLGLAALVTLLRVVQALDADEILAQHNVYRCMHDTPFLTYNDDLAADAQAYAETLAATCGSLVHDTTADGENLAFCANSPAPVETCSSGFDATPKWYDEVQFYVPGPNGGANPSTEDVGHFTQVIWESSTELGCGSADCTVASRSGTFFRTYVVCRYRPAGNVLSQYLDNVNHVVSTDEATCTDIVAAHGDPHMVGFQHQKFDFTGEDGQWYALIHDSAMDLDMNMRITQPMSEVPQVTYITGIGLSVLGADDEVHTFEIVIGDPHSLSPECSERDGRPCLADGALTILVDGKEAGVGEVCSKRCVRSGCPKELGSGVYLSALNLPGECRPFGNHKYWLEKNAKADVSASRRLRTGSRQRKAYSPGIWIVKDRYRTDPEACDKYVREASAAGTLFEHQSEHTSLQITAPSISLRVNIGKAYQEAVRDPTDSFDIPAHVGYRINLAFESLDDVSLNAQGILGETIQLRYDADGNPITSGPGCIRGEEPMYEVSGPLARGFTLDI